MNGPSLEATLVDLAKTALCSSGLGMSPDIAASPTQAEIAILLILLIAKLSSCLTLALDYSLIRSKWSYRLQFHRGSNPKHLLGLGHTLVSSMWLRLEDRSTAQKHLSS